MQAIVTKYLGPTNVRGSRIKAACDRGSITVPYDHSAHCPHETARRALVEKFAQEDGEPGTSHWLRPMIGGDLPGPNGGKCFVFAEGGR